ncbi:hypothetical protein GO495_15720 [Chitinophaga oryziterrae]|uniref:Uncharacterized protein n=1 Tax=Chitinophaga oryziterrae TaxID=1031224 RepID=A0A6N8J9Y3_9BACT|nr:hypothetical protein [Chitinophaga oryziterrae]MVT42040.1 hypothetical protein [Chitinophaga oryziterrae]
MKKAKIMLSAIAVLAVVGGAFAFKANKFNPGRTLYYINPGAACLPTTLTTVNWGTTTVTTGPATVFRSGFYTTSLCVGPVTIAYPTNPQ